MNDAKNKALKAKSYGEKYSKIDKIMKKWNKVSASAIANYKKIK